MSIYIAHRRRKTSNASTLTVSTYNEYNKKGATFIFAITLENLGRFLSFFHYCILRSTADKSGIKTTTSPQVCCRTTLRRLECATVQLYKKVIKLNMVQ